MVKKDTPKSAQSQSAALTQLMDTAMTLKYIGDYLLQGQCNGYEVPAHDRAIQLVKAQFDQVDADVKAHADYPAYLEKARAQQAEKANA